MKTNDFLFCIDTLENGCIGKKLSLKDSVNLGLFSVWNLNKIRKAFNFGNGTEKDFYNHAENNKQKVLTETEFKNKFPEYYKRYCKYIESEKGRISKTY